MANLVCPACGWRIHRSHTRGINEKLIRAVTTYRTYRCYECGWRGWMGKAAPAVSYYRLRTWLIVLLGLIVTLLLVLYLVRELSQPPTTGEQTLYREKKERTWGGFPSPLTEPLDFRAKITWAGSRLYIRPQTGDTIRGPRLSG